MTESILKSLKNGPLKVGVIGCGNWGTTIGLTAALNVVDSYLFDKEVMMYCRDQPISDKDDTSLVDFINKHNENPCYLPGIALPKNLLAVRDLSKIVLADLIIIVVPHQFLHANLEAIKKAGGLKKNARCLSLIKGIDVQNKKVSCYSQVIEAELGRSCSVLSGANVAMDIAKGYFSETTIGYTDHSAAEAWQALIERPNFQVQLYNDVTGIQVSGALKNLVAVSAGFCDGMGYGTNTKSAIIRIGVNEMRKFAQHFFPESHDAIYFESCGYADVITTSFGGRNVKCAAEFARRGGSEHNVNWSHIESDLLGNQKMQGQLICKEIYILLAEHGLLAEYPLFHATYDVSFGGKPNEYLLDVLRYK